MKIKVLFGNLIIAILAAFLAIVIYANYFQDELAVKPDVETQTQNNLNLLEDSNQVHQQRKLALSGDLLDFTEAAEKSVHAVVHVTSTYNLQNNDSYSNPLYEFFFGDGYKRQPSVSFGSGVIISEDGYIVTNNHVVENSDEIQVVLNDKRTYTAEIVGADPSTDLALLKVNANDLLFIPFGNSDYLRIGEWVLAVGNPFNLTSTVTAGIVSAKARNINILDRSTYPIESYIQTDAAVNQGNSGGALVNLAGELVGINSAIISPSGAYSGYSFAIPTSIVKKVVADLIKYGEVQRAVLGVTIEGVTDQRKKDYNLDKIEGIVITNLTVGGAAKDAGLKVGDVILEINNVIVNSNSELTEQISRYRPGELINITIKRDNKKKQFDVVLRNRQGNTEIVKPDNYFRILGATFENISDSDKRRYGIDGGVGIVDLQDGAFKKARIKDNFIIIRVQGESINKIKDLKEILRQVGMGAEIEINGIYPGERYIFVYKVKLE